MTTAEDPDDVDFTFYVDDDDRATLDFLNNYERGRFCGVVTGERVVLSEMWNRCYENFTSTQNRPDDIFMHCGDDIVFHTPGWDTLVKNAFDAVPDKIVLVYGRDGIQDEGLATHGFYSRRAVEALGYFVPPYFSSDYNDLWLTEIYREVGRLVYLPEMYTEHMHPVAGKAEYDQTHQDRLARHVRDDVATIYADKAAERVADVAKLRNAINDYVSAQDDQ
jgi:hypothetical protein